MEHKSQFLIRTIKPTLKLTGPMENLLELKILIEDHPWTHKKITLIFRISLLRSDIAHKLFFSFIKSSP